jgi:hypothetical protein
LAEKRQYCDRNYKPAFFHGFPPRWFCFTAVSRKQEGILSPRRRLVKRREGAGLPPQSCDSASEVEWRHGD